MGKVIVRGASARQKVLDIVKNGGSLDDAAAETGYGRNYCRQLAAKAGMRFERGKYKTGKAEKHRRITELYAKGNDPKQIADILGYKSTTSIYVALHKSGVLIRKKRKLSIYEIRICPQCNSAFYCHENHNQRFCGKECERRYTWKRNDPARRARKRNAIIDKDITLQKVAEKDGNICYLCGEKVDWNDFKYIRGVKTTLKKYPSIDHVIALKNGGKHEWGNVRLAHVCCNAAKGAS